MAGDTQKEHKKRIGLFFFFQSFFLTNRINYMYMYFRSARSRSLFILASTLGDMGDKMAGGRGEECKKK